MQTRRYDIDWLRVIAIGFLLIYHVAIPFQPWGVFIGFIQSPESIESLWVPMSLLSIWRIPLLFFVSGMGVYFSMRKRNWKKLLTERTQRILLPFIIGTILIVPLQVFLWQVYYHQDLKPQFHPAHLWFLGNIFSYVILLVPLLFYMKKKQDTLRIKLAKLVDHPVKLLLWTIPFIGQSLLIDPEHYTMYALTFHGYVLGFLAFFLGYLFVYTGDVFWHTVNKWKWSFLFLGFVLYFVRLLYFDMESPVFLMSIETLIWIYALLGLGFKYLNFSNSYLSYLSEVAYPVYILHWIFIHLGSLLLFPMELAPMLKFIGLVIFTFGGSLITYHVLIRRVFLLRPLFGLKNSSKGRRISLTV
ncbi:acyltransferase family protein [Ekhidna sp.]|uniref:acyltransferase family protein n=1 Tax=Ekhidna sp. TaxID=2608089 RepID=UPI003B5B6082